MGRRQDKCFEALLKIYEEVYASIGVDFHAVDKTENWFMNYEIDSKEEEVILNRVMAQYKLTKLEKKAVSINYWLGCSPKSIKGVV